MKTSYKFWYVHKSDDIHISEVAVRFYEGEMLAVQQEYLDVISNKITPIETVKYVRTKRLQKADLPHINTKFVQEEDSNDCAVYTSQDFGVTSNLDDVIIFLNKELAKDEIREPQETQKETVKENLVLQEIK